MELPSTLPNTYGCIKVASKLNVIGQKQNVFLLLPNVVASNHHPLASPVLGNKDVSICSASSTTHSDTSKEPRLTDKPLPDDDATAETTQSSSTLFTSKSTLNDEEEEDDDSEQNFPNDLPVNIESFEDRKWSKSLHFFAMNLAYLETPQYLRRQLFTMHPNLKMAGLQNPLDAPHHMRAHEWLPFRYFLHAEAYIPARLRFLIFQGRSSYRTTERIRP